MRSSVLRYVTGWALVAGAIGVFWDEIACGGCSEGSLGLIPAYLGLTVGLVGLVPVFWRASGHVVAIIAGLGVAAILYFMFAYPDGAEGWVGAILIGFAHLWLPPAGRMAAVPWFAAGFWDAPNYQFADSWGPLNAFVLLGVSAAISGAWVLLGASMPNAERTQLHS